jgi:CGNR zinc finger/Putative stress-induced transcription regulator
VNTTVSHRHDNQRRAYSGVVTGLAAGDHDVTLVLDFLNTLDIDSRTDVLDDELAWHGWLADRGLAAGSGRAHARSARDALRSLVGDPGSGQISVPRVSLQVEFQTGQPRLHAPDAVGAVLAAASRVAVLGEWERIKICPADDCQWAFFDRSRNRSRTWCSMQICGNREKARVWRERTKASAG